MYKPFFNSLPIEHDSNRLVSYLEYGTFGRLSVMAADWKEAIEHSEYIYCNSLYHHLLNDFDKNIARHKIEQARVHFLDYLINLTECIVLSDYIAEIQQLGTASLFKDGPAALDFPTRVNVNEDIIYPFPDIANRLRDRTELFIDIKPMSLNNHTLQIAWELANRAHLYESDIVGWDVLDKNGKFSIDNYQTCIYNDEDAILNSKDWPEFTRRLEILLGQNFIDFQQIIQSKSKTIPIDVMYAKTHGFRPDIYTPSRNIAAEKIAATEFSRFLLDLQSYLHYMSMSQTSSLILPSWSTKPLLSLLASSPISAARVSIDMPDRFISDALTSKGVIAANLSIPQILRTCLDGAKNLEDVITNAGTLRNTQWATDYRDYLRDILNSSIHDLPKKLNKTHQFIKKRVEGNCAIGDANLTISASGACSVGIGGVVDVVRSRLDKAFVFHSKLMNAENSRTQITQLSNILSVNKHQIIKHMKK